MDSYIAKHRYAARRVSTGGRKRRPVRGRKYSLKEIVVFQSLICAILLVIIIIFKIINISATNFITDRVKYILMHNIDLNSVFSYIDRLAVDVRNSIIPDSADKTALRNEAGSADMRETGKNPSADSSQTLSFAQTSAAEATGTSKIQDENNMVTATLSSSADDLIASEHSGEEDESGSSETSVLSASSKNVWATMLMPVEGTIATGFGEVVESIDGNGKTHTGIDICVTGACSVRAAMDGKVAETGLSRDYGRYVRLEHDNSLYTIYANCHSIAVQKGDVVKKGDTIAGIDDMSISAGRHLHFEVWEGGDAVDPLLYINTAGG